MAEEKQSKAVTDEQEKAPKETQPQKRSKKHVRRLIPVWAKLLIIVILSLFALIIGLMIGFSVIGDGSPLDVLKLELWEHIVDFVRVDKEK